MDELFGLLIGISLSAACGFRIFVPFLVLGVANQGGHVNLSPDFQWIASDAAIWAFGIATVFEILAFYVPWVDNALDALAAPIAVVAGTILTATMVSDFSPLMKWTLAIIAGGGSAGIVQTSTTMIRAGSTMTTGGGGNFVVSTGEWLGSLLVSIISIIFPLIIVFGVLFLLFTLLKKVIFRGKATLTP